MSEPARPRDKLRDILHDNPGMAKADVAALAAVHVRTVERVRRELNGAARGPA